MVQDGKQSSRTRECKPVLMTAGKSRLLLYCIYDLVAGIKSYSMSLKGETSALSLKQYSDLFLHSVHDPTKKANL
jgi:hypothetical protein